MKVMIFSLLVSMIGVETVQAQSPIFKTADYNTYQEVSSQLTQVALAKIRPEFIEEFKETVNKFLPRLRSQFGNISYEYSQNQEDPSEFIFYEKWLNGKSIKGHMESPLIQEFFGLVGQYFEPGFPQLIILKNQGI